MSIRSRRCAPSKAVVVRVREADRRYRRSRRAPWGRLPVRPDLEQLQRQAKEFLRAVHAGGANAIAELREHLAGPAYTLSVEGTAALFALGARIVGPEGVDRNAHVRHRRRFP